MVHVALVALAAFVIAAASPANATDASDREARFAAAVADIIDGAIRPGYAAFSETAEAQSVSMQALCAAPGEAALTKARERFAGLAAAWSRVELVRFGPAREDNRFEKLFYWPDRKGRGLKQVQRLLASEDETASQTETLRRKSVAVQGLPALEFVLFGKGSDELARVAGYRCAYGAAIAGAIAANAAEIAESWSGDDGYGALMRAAGPDNPSYRTHAEALQALLGAAREQLQVARDLKLLAVISETPDKAKPKRAPLWRSNLTITSLRGNIAGALAFFSAGIDGLLPEDAARHANSLHFEGRQADGTLAALAESGADWVILASDAETHARLAYLPIPLGGMIRLATETYPGTLGLIVGFNSTDGD